MPFDPDPIADKVGVLLINLGTPDAPEQKAVRRYLAQFLSDPRVVELPALLWKPILHGLVLRRRPARSASAYAAIWQPGGSPLAVHTAAQAEALASRLGPMAAVEYGMRYGNPSIEHAIDRLIARGVERILLAPLYPQYSAATTATALDCAYQSLKTKRHQPAIRTLPPYFAEPAHIDALARSIEWQLGQLPFEPDAILASFHGMPVRTEQMGDPYRRQCLETISRLQACLGREILTSFQSRFGAARWFEPATDVVLGNLPGQGVRRLAVVTPGFSADCVETLEEIGIRGRETFTAAGGTDFALLACLNDEEPGMAMLETLVRRELAGWIAA